MDSQSYNWTTVNSYSSKLWIFIKRINFHQNYIFSTNWKTFKYNNEFLTNWYIFIIVMNFYQDFHLSRDMIFHIHNHFSSDRGIFQQNIKVMAFHQSCDFFYQSDDFYQLAFQWKWWMFIKVMKFHHIGNFSSKWWIFNKVENCHRSNFSSNQWILKW